MKGFLLGLASGAVCLAYCAPILVPYLLSEANMTRRNLVTLLCFLTGRLIGYSLFAVIAWLPNVVFVQNLPNRTLVFGLIYTLLAILLILYGFGNPLRCLAKSAKSLGKWAFPGHRMLFPVALGLLTGLNVCPPFLLAFASAAEMASLWGCLLFFLTFFARTSIYLIPLSGLGLLRRHDFLRPIGRLAAGVIGVYSLCLGLLVIKGSFS